MDKPGILIIENSVAVTGALNSILRSSAALRSTYDFFFVLPRDSEATSYVQQQGFSVIELPMKELKKDFWVLIVYFPMLIANTIRLRSQLKKLRIQLVVNNDFYNLLPVVYKVWGGSIPYVTYVRFRPKRFPKVLQAVWCWCHRWLASAVIAVSETVKKELPFQEKVIVIGNELPEKEMPYKASVSTTILYPANYIPGKGHEFALRSFAAIHHQFPLWRLRFVGGDMALQKNQAFKLALQNEARHLGVGQKIEWGDFSRNMQPEYLQASIVLNFSESESFSLTCLEAMFYGRVVLATRCGGPEEIIEEGTGYLVDLFDLEGMSTALSKLMADPAVREAMGRKAYDSVRRRYNHASTIGKLGELYSQILSPNGIFLNTR